MTEYDIGYKKPPEGTQFQKGHSGNPNGRPKGAKNTASVLKDVLGQEMTISKNGVKQKATVLESMLQRAVQQSFEGDYKAMKLLLSMGDKYGMLFTPEDQLPPTPPNIIVQLVSPPVNDAERVIWNSPPEESMQYLKDHPDELEDMVRKIYQRKQKDKR